MPKVPERMEGHLMGGVRVLGHGTHKRPPTGQLETHLRVEVVLQVEREWGVQAKALLDTGAEVNLVRNGLLPDSAFHQASHPLRIIAANNQQLEGGDSEVNLAIHFNAVDVNTKAKYILSVPTSLYKADIDQDVILSYRWMGERDIRIGPRPHGFWLSTKGQTLWVDGIRTVTKQRANARLPRVPVSLNVLPAPMKTDGKRMALDLFCGRKSASSVLEKWGFQVVTLDNDPKRNPKICMDVMAWNYRSQYPLGILN